MGRYQNIKVKMKQKDKTQHLRTTIYSSIPETDEDIYVITQMGDRLDLLAYQFYKDRNLWWYIAKANNLKDLRIPAGTSLRIPGSTKYATAR